MQFDLKIATSVALWMFVLQHCVCVWIANSGARFGAKWWASKGFYKGVVDWIILGTPFLGLVVFAGMVYLKIPDFLQSTMLVLVMISFLYWFANVQYLYRHETNFAKYCNEMGLEAPDDPVFESIAKYEEHRDFLREKFIQNTPLKLLAKNLTIRTMLTNAIMVSFIVMVVAQHLGYTDTFWGGYIVAAFSVMCTLIFTKINPDFYRGADGEQGLPGLQGATGKKGDDGKCDCPFKNAPLTTKEQLNPTEAPIVFQCDNVRSELRAAKAELSTEPAKPPIASVGELYQELDFLSKFLAAQKPLSADDQRMLNQALDEANWEGTSDDGSGDTSPSVNTQDAAPQPTIGVGDPKVLFDQTPDNVDESIRKQDNLLRCLISVAASKHYEAINASPKDPTQIAQLALPQPLPTENKTFTWRISPTRRFGECEAIYPPIDKPIFPGDPWVSHSLPTSVTDTAESKPDSDTFSSTTQE